MKVKTAKVQLFRAATVEIEDTGIFREFYVSKTQRGGLSG